MNRCLSREERKARFLAEAAEMFESIEEWYDEHPEATFGEIEQEARRGRRELMGSGLEVLINGRDRGKEEAGPECEKCNEKMKFKGYRAKWVQGLEGDSHLERAYYVCSECEGETTFPPR